MRLIGRGAYKLRRKGGKTYRRRGTRLVKNNLFGTRPSRVTSTIRNETNAITISNREYIGELTPTTGDFQTLYQSNINPGLISAFPWLSNIAQFYEEYEFVQLVYEIKSMVTAGNDVAAGSIVAVAQYNAENPEFTNKISMQQYEHAISAKVTANTLLGVECKPRHVFSKNLFVRT